MNDMKADMKFEEAILKLEELVSRLEGGTLPLSDSLDAFEQAVALVKVCEARLSDARGRVRILTEGADGTVTDRPFDSNGDAT